MAKKEPYRVMEYLNESATGVVGWVLLTPGQHRKWSRNPRSRGHVVSGYCIVSGMELMAETGTVPCARLWDYHHTIAQLPEKPFDETSLLHRFQMAADHPALC